MSQSFSDIFIEESRDLIADLITALLELENEPTDKELVARIFRALHTIKGSGAMFGFESISEFAHHLENLFDRVRSNQMRLSKDLIDLTLTSVDLISKMLDNQVLPPDLTSLKTDIIDRINARLSSDGASGEAEKPQAQDIPQSAEPVNQTYRIIYTPHRPAFRQGIDVTEPLKEFRSLGNTLVMARTAAIPTLFELDPENCHFSWIIILTTRRGLDSIKDITLMVEEYALFQIDLIDDGQSDSPDYKKLGDILVERGDITLDEMNLALSQQRRFGEILLSQGSVQSEAIETALIEQKHVRQLRQSGTDRKESTSLRVSSEKVDMLVNLVGELVTLQARLNQISNQRYDADLLSVSEEMERLTSELRDHTMDIRMFPIGSTFSQFRRLVRDLSSQLGKEIELTTEGDETELDKSVIEKLHDPLVHIIRNCIDHGIETPSVRTESGKSPLGTINLSATHSGGFVVIQITDDGKGLDVEAIRKKAVEKGMIQADTQLNEQKIYNLIFEPGFSTAAKVTDVSGRGVGMDVVKRNVEALRGAIQVESEVGMGTTVTLRIPLTMAIIDGLLVQIGMDRYVMPLALVEECIEITHRQILLNGQQQIIQVRGTMIPYIYLHEVFEHESEPPEIEQIIVIRNENRRVGLVVDHVIGGHQTVIKNMGAYLKNLKGISGATILGDGTIALILDIPHLVKEVENQIDRADLSTKKQTIKGAFHA
jgi:two-component system chemotaxis sensor kinase CheA